MADAISVSGPISGTDRTMSFEAGKFAQLADGAVRGPHRGHHPAGHRHRGPLGAGGDRLLPPDRGHRGAGLRRRQDPRLVLPPGGQGLGPGHPDRPAHRPPAAAVLPRGIPQRGAHRRHHPRRRPGQPARRPGHQRRLGGADDLGHPLRRPHRGRPGRLHHRGHLDPASDLRGGRDLDLRAGGGGSRPDRGRRQGDRHHDGGGRREREVVVLLPGGRPQGHRGGAGGGPRGVQAMDPRVHQPAAPAGRGVRRGAGPNRDHPVLDLHRLRAKTCGPGWRRSGPSPSPRPTW